MRGVSGRLVREQRGQHQLLAVHGCGMDGGARCAERMHCAADTIAHASANASADAIAHAAAHAAADGIANAVADAIADPCANARADSGAVASADAIAIAPPHAVADAVADATCERVQPHRGLQAGVLLQPRHASQHVRAVHCRALQQHAQHLHGARGEQRDGMCGVRGWYVRSQRGQHQLRSVRCDGVDLGARCAALVHCAADTVADASADASANASAVTEPDAEPNAEPDTRADAGADAARE